MNLEERCKNNTNFPKTTQKKFATKIQKYNPSPSCYTTSRLRRKEMALKKTIRSVMSELKFFEIPKKMIIPLLLIISPNGEICWLACKHAAKR